MSRGDRGRFLKPKKRGTARKTNVHREGRRVTITLAEPVIVRAGEAFNVVVHW